MSWSSCLTAVLPLMSWVAVTLIKRLWSGEHVKVQKRLKKLSLQAGHEAMMVFAVESSDFRDLT